MYKTIIKLNSPEHYCLEMTCHTHGWKSLAPFNWDGINKVLNYAIMINSISTDVMVTQRKNIIETKIYSNEILQPDHLWLLKLMLIRSLCLDVDVNKLLLKAEKNGLEYKSLILKGAGRLLKSSSIWEDTVKTLFTTNCTWALTKKMCEAACSKNFTKPTPNGKYPFPSPLIFLQYEPEELQKLMPIGYRADYLWNIAKSFSESLFFQGIDTNRYERHQVENAFKNLKGFGRYSTAHMLVLSGFFDFVPIDTDVISFLKNEYRVRKPESFIKRHYKKWGDQIWWGYKFDRILKRANWLGN